MNPAESPHNRIEEQDRGGSAVTGLGRRYTRWTAVFYPVDYRRERGSELVDTYCPWRRPDAGDPQSATSRSLRSVDCGSI